MIVRYYPISLPFEYPFTISGGRTKTHQPSLIISLSVGNITGWGEAPAIAYYGVTLENMIAALESKKQMIEKFAFTTPERFWHFLHHLLPQHPFLVAALDIAGWDMFGKIRKQPLFQLWETTWNTLPPTDYTIGIDSPDRMLSKMKAKPWPVYKVKLGTKEDLGIMQQLTRNSAAIFRVDANAGWTLDEARFLIPELSKMGIELIEQPLAKDNWEGMKELMQSTTIPLIADETCVSEMDVEKCIGYFTGINIKLTKCSGITPAIRMIEKAKANQLQVMMGSMNETSVGSAAIAQFLPQLDYVDADGPLLLSQDIATGVSYSNGQISVSSQPGLGVQLTHLPTLSTP
ncbi:MAG: dipeptide epimerase [Sediminibacterium sp.]|nr:dipeptide epimerase [Sediminibacterium sp.]